VIFWYAFVLLFPSTFGGMQAYQDFVLNAYLWLMLGILWGLPGLRFRFAKKFNASSCHLEESDGRFRAGNLLVRNGRQPQGRFAATAHVAGANRHAFYVVLFHSRPWLMSHFNLPGSLITFLGNGYLAVALFFLLSGFILSYTYAGNVENGRQHAKFWEPRFARIYPVYFLSLMLALPFQRALPLTTKIAVLAMVQAWNPFRRGWTGAWNYPAWSLSVEAFFYLCFPFIQKRISRAGDR
jgi:hypothetical protein